MEMKWALAIVGAVAAFALFSNVFERNTDNGVSSSLSFALSDMKQADRDEWRALIETCESAPDDDQHFQYFGSSTRDFYFNGSERLLCQFSDDDPVNAYLAFSELPRTHRLVVASRGNQTQWTFGPIPAQERN
ncbi:hypothetical protein [Aurantiacibacter zhengii]|uniref:Uncharacterized protein n=1 Tax=Aurantiacibacter zhengii TaxID=2307003 RepID=A0A418NWT1_9SPHN|nr:hypothetical protein [Aurantiacibacter zhengii]RIV89062.1 hypothetical protein D2V07_02060 [Aurantiacibacter zhengii]